MKGREGVGATMLIIEYNIYRFLLDALGAGTGEAATSAADSLSLAAGASLSSAASLIIVMPLTLAALVVLRVVLLVALVSAVTVVFAMVSSLDLAALVVRLPF